jgi:hypothetical protein
MGWAGLGTPLSIPGGNLSTMSLDEERCRRLSAEWEESGQSQAVWCAARGLKARTLRSWRQKFCRERQPEGDPTTPDQTIAAALQAFEARLAALEVAVDAALAAVATCRAAAMEEPSVDADDQAEPVAMMRERVSPIEESVAAERVAGSHVAAPDPSDLPPAVLEQHKEDAMESETAPPSRSKKSFFSDFT